MWKHSPIYNKMASPGGDGGDDSLVCSFHSPDSNDNTVADECFSSSPSMPMVQQFPKVHTKIQSLPASGPKALVPTNFHNNYLKLGMWPELTYSKQMLLRNSYKQVSRENLFVRNSQQNLNFGSHQQMGYLQTSMSQHPAI
jgi:hypothetical protein